MCAAEMFHALMHQHAWHMRAAEMYHALMLRHAWHMCTAGMYHAPMPNHAWGMCTANMSDAIMLQHAWHTCACTPRTRVRRSACLRLVLSSCLFDVAVAVIAIVIVFVR